MFREECDSSSDYPLGGTLEPYDMEVDMELMDAAREMREKQSKSIQREWMLKPVCRWGYRVRDLTKHDVDMMAMQCAIQS